MWSKSNMSVPPQGGSSLDLSPSDSCGSGGTYMWDEEGLEPLGGAAMTASIHTSSNTTHHIGSFDSDLNSIVRTNLHLTHIRPQPSSRLVCSLDDFVAAQQRNDKKERLTFRRRLLCCPTSFRKQRLRFASTETPQWKCFIVMESRVRLAQGFLKSELEVSQWSSKTI